MSPQKLKVSQVARMAGVGSDSIRHYERLGILPKAERSASGYRLWNAHDVRYLKWIAPAKRAGFTLHELSEIFQMYRAGKPPCQGVRDLLQRKLVDLNHQIDELSTLRNKLRPVLARWNGRLSQAAPGEFVALFDDLSNGSHSSTRAPIRLKTHKRRKQ
ncbi:MAG: MerR family DNA-binding protein [Candidatus Acidiferrales bacterium]